MKNTGMIRKIDELGRVVIPIEIRKALGINNKDSLEIQIENNAIILSKSNTCCILCDSAENLVEMKNKKAKEKKYMCIDCLDEINLGH